MSHEQILHRRIRRWVWFFIIGLVITILFQTVLYQIAVRVKNGTLSRSRAAILSLLACLSSVFVASPLIAMWERLHT